MTTESLSPVDAARKRRKISQAELAKRAGIEANHASLICRGLVPSPATRQKIAQVLSESSEVLFPGAALAEKRAKAQADATAEANADASRNTNGEDVTEVQPFIPVTPAEVIDP